MNQILKFFLAILFCCGFVQTNAQLRQDHALFFVVSDFDHWADFPASSEQQVREIESELKTNYGFKTEFILNPTRRQVLDKLSSYQSKRFGEQDQLLIYFSMHGEYKEGGTGALIPKDGKLKDNYGDTWIRHPLLADLVNDIPCDHVLLALDACYSGTFGGSRGKPGGAAFNREADCDDKIKQALQHKSRQYATSGGAERTPTDSQFADKWLEALRLRNTDGVLNYAELFGVLHDAYPRPMYGEFKDHVKGGDFVFVNRSACGSFEEVTDQSHWVSLQQNVTREGLVEHLSKYPKCPHESDVIYLLGGGKQEKTADVTTKANKNRIRSSKPEKIDVKEGCSPKMIRNGDTIDYGKARICTVTLDDDPGIWAINVSVSAKGGGHSYNSWLNDGYFGVEWEGTKKQYFVPANTKYFQAQFTANKYVEEGALKIHVKRRKWDPYRNVWLSDLIEETACIIFPINHDVEEKD